MRTSVLLAVLLALSAAASSQADVVHAAHRLAGEAHSKIHPAAHVLRQLDTAITLSGSTSAECQAKMTEMLTDFAGAQTACASASALDNITSPALLDAAYATFCRSGCIATMSRLFSKFAACLPASVASSVKSLGAVCVTDQGKYCGATLSLARYADCSSRYLESMCAAPYQCQWIAGSCRPTPSNTFLDSICTGCVQKIINLLIADPTQTSNEILAAARASQMLTCAKVGNTYCLPLMSAVSQRLATNGNRLDNATVQSICENPTTMRCYNVLTEGTNSVALDSAARTFQSCVARYTLDSSKDLFCVPAFRSAWEKAAVDSRTLRNMCARNDRGSYCVGFANAVAASCATSGSCSTSCPGGNGSSPCATSCAANNSALVDAMGCCMGTLEEVLGAPPPFPASALPPHNRTNPATSAPPPAETTAPTRAPVNFTSSEELRPNPSVQLMYGLSNANCVSANATRNLRVKCKQPPPPPPMPKALPVRLVFNALTPAMRLSVIASLTTDVARALGVATTDIINATLTADPSQRIPLAASRRLRMLADGDGTQFSFQLQSANAAVTTAAAAAFDTMATAKSISLPSTTSLVAQQCASTCAGAAGVSGLNPETSSSSAAILATFVSVVVATLALLM